MRRRLCLSTVLVALLVPAFPAAPASAAPAERPVSWVPLSPTTSPPAQGDAAMAFNPAINKMVLFGTAGETWTFDGKTWTRETPATSPSLRSGAAMAYHPVLGKIVLFGSHRGGTGFAETWTYDGVNWVQQLPARSPGPLVSASMAFDPHRRTLVLFGGSDPYPGFRDPLVSDDTWTYDGLTWTLEAPATRPPARADAAMAFDPGSGRIVLFGGSDNDVYLICGSRKFGDTWTYDGTTWTQQSPVDSPRAEWNPVMANDPATGQLVLFGGGEPYRHDYAKCEGHIPHLYNTWTYKGSTWTRLAPSVSPSHRRGAALAYDPRSGRLIMFGGYGANGRLDETWAYQPVGTGYRLVAADGGVFTFGASYRGSTGSLRLQRPIVGMAANPGTDGYWLTASDGGVFAFGAPFFGSTGNRPPRQPVVGMAAAPNGKGYWLATRDGEVFNFGAGAQRDRTTVPTQLKQPIVGISADPMTHGYRLVASDGGVFTFNAPYYGSTGNLHLNQPIVGMAADPATGGYWLVASDGGVFSFNAPFFGSLGGRHLNQPIVGITAAPGGSGYWLVAKDGGVFSFGPGATFRGSTGGLRLNQPIVGMTGS